MVVVVVIGMPICEAFAQIEQQPNIYDVVHVKYFDEVWFRELHVYFTIFQKFNWCYIWYFVTHLCCESSWRSLIFLYIRVLCSLDLVSTSYGCCLMQEPLKLDLVISFPDHGFHLRFDPWSQVILLFALVFLLGFLVAIQRILSLLIINGMMKLLNIVFAPNFVIVSVILVTSTLFWKDTIQNC